MLDNIVHGVVLYLSDYAYWVFLRNIDGHCSLAHAEALDRRWWLWNCQETMRMPIEVFISHEENERVGFYWHSSERLWLSSDSQVLLKSPTIAWDSRKNWVMSWHSLAIQWSEGSFRSVEGSQFLLYYEYMKQMFTIVMLFSPVLHHCSCWNLS